MTASRESVLLLTFARRGEESAIREALVALEREFPRASVFSVATPASTSVLNRLWVGDLVLYDSGGSAWRVLREVAARRPRAAAIVYGGDRPEGHLKLEVVALASGAGIIYRCLGGSRVERSGRLRLLGSVICKTALTCAHVTAGAAMCAVAFCWLAAAPLVSRGGQGKARRTEGSSRCE